MDGIFRVWWQQDELEMHFDPESEAVKIICNRDDNFALQTIKLMKVVLTCIQMKTTLIRFNKSKQKNVKKIHTKNIFRKIRKLNKTYFEQNELMWCKCWMEKYCFEHFSRLLWINTVFVEIICYMVGQCFFNEKCIHGCIWFDN